MAKYTVKLTKEEVEELTAIINKGKHSQVYPGFYNFLYMNKVTNRYIVK